MFRFSTIMDCNIVLHWAVSKDLCRFVCAFLGERCHTHIQDAMFNFHFFVFLNQKAEEENRLQWFINLHNAMLNTAFFFFAFYINQGWVPVKICRDLSFYWDQFCPDTKPSLLLTNPLIFSFVNVVCFLKMTHFALVVTVVSVWIRYKNQWRNWPQFIHEMLVDAFWHLKAKRSRPRLD